MSTPPQADIQRIGTVEGAQKLLEILNYEPDQAILNKCNLKASIMIADIYAEVGTPVLPADHAADPELFELADECAAAHYRLLVASTPAEKLDAREDIDMCKKGVLLHIGVVKQDGSPVEVISDPQTFVGPRTDDIT